jgi:hypothetical protein
VEEKAGISAAFGTQTRLQKAELIQHLRQNQPDISPSNLNWRIHQLIQQRQLVRIGRGRYALPQKASYQPAAHPYAQEIATAIKQQFPYARFSVFHTEQLSALMQHLPGRHLLVVEVERDAIEAVFFHLQSIGKRCFLKPTALEMSNYVAFEEQPIVLQPLLTEAPLLYADQVPMPALEKFLVDLVSEKAIYHAYQGAELRHIFAQALEAYHVVMDRLLRYARRRNRQAQVLQFLNFFDTPTTT